MNPCCVNLKLFKNFAADVSGVSLNNFRFTQHGFTTFTKHRNKHCRALEILKKIWIYGSPIYLAACTFKIGMNSAGSTLGIFLKDMCDLHEIVTG